MYNFIFTADGKFVKNNNIIESFENNFSISNDQICIDDTCLTKSEITLIKKKVSENDLDKIINDKDILSNEDVILYIKDILKQIKDSNDDQYKYTLFDKYLSYGIFDDRTNTSFKIHKYYIKLDFNKFFDDIETRNVFTGTFKENEVLKILTNNRIDDDKDPRKKYVIINKDIIGVNNNNYYLVYEGEITYFLLLVKLKTEEENRWRVLITSEKLIDEISIEISDNFTLMFKNNFDNILAFNIKEELLIDDFKNLINNYKIISISKGEYDYNLLKVNLFLNYYDNIINLENFDENYFNENIENSNTFEKKTFSSDKIIDLKLRMNLEDIKLIYYKLNNELFIYLISILEPGSAEYSWKILILENTI